jgi:signal transduction histidine kinase
MTFTFSVAVFQLDQSFQLSDSNGSYIVTGWLLFFIVFLIVDYVMLLLRVRKLMNFAEANASTADVDEFTYPIDKIYADCFAQLVVDFETYKGDIRTNSAEEAEFITKWLHDVQVPIAATRLIIDTQENQMPPPVYESLSTELFAIEESVQRVFYEMKSNRFSDDYKIAPVQTKQLIVHALKGFSNLFSYKKIHILIEGEETSVLTDEKWSGYILSQLISNAVKHTSPGGVIAIITSENNRKTTISIKNTGKGILESDIGQVFQKGYTSSDNRTGMKATGYGLYLSKKLSNLLGHELTVESTYNQDAIFHLTFFENETIHDVTKM